VVELRVFEGLNADEIASRMQCSVRTVTRYWTYARNWLAQEFGEPATA
jgi:DNA-directed RNA polymerase specialized sigma24 family protein